MLPYFTHVRCKWGGMNFPHVFAVDLFSQHHHRHHHVHFSAPLKHGQLHYNSHKNIKSTMKNITKHYGCSKKCELAVTFVPLGVAVTPEIDMAAKTASPRSTQQPDYKIQCVFPHFRAPAILSEVQL